MYTTVARVVLIQRVTPQGEGLLLKMPVILLSVGLANTTKKNHYYPCEVTISDLTLEECEPDITLRFFTCE